MHDTDKDTHLIWCPDSGATNMPNARHSYDPNDAFMANRKANYIEDALTNFSGLSNAVTNAISEYTF